MYVYGFDLFFDFTGYSMFALAASNLIRIKSPHQLWYRPFKSRDLRNSESLAYEFNSGSVILSLCVSWYWCAISIQEPNYHLKCCLYYQYVGHGLRHGWPGTTSLTKIFADPDWLSMMLGFVRKRPLIKKKKSKGLDPIPDNRWTKALGSLSPCFYSDAVLLFFSGFAGPAMVSKWNKRNRKMDVKSQMSKLLTIVYGDIPDLHSGWGSLWCRVSLDSMGTVNWLWRWKIALASMFLYPGRDDWNLTRS